MRENQENRDSRRGDRDDMSEFCQSGISRCFDCDIAHNCPLLNELVLKHAGKNGINQKEYRKGSVHPRNTLNELSGEEWLYFTKTLMVTSYSRKYGHEIRKKHGANKPPELMKCLIEFFTRGGERVLDPFAGVGGTLLGAAIAVPARECTGIEISQKWIDIYRQVIESCNSSGETLSLYPLIQGDCLEVMKTFQNEYFQFVATDPPYNLHFEKTMCNGSYLNFSNRQTDYDMQSEDPADLANLSSYENYLDAIGCVLQECFRVLENGRYMVMIIRNAYQNGRYIFTSADIAGKARLSGFVPKGEIIWYEAGTRLRPYGYPYSYVPNIAHQYILVFQKPLNTRKPSGKKTVRKLPV